ncbi:hypothetical protein JKA74_08220 [Marivirga sp. S37H4]|uniref:Uncharacterized protein n=1 Tax=Marivirga aurantiaca TaxID=2802615 RepID=A0A934WY78_9BACT|nr:hypothetical protein [Marivirga aurantiaca]MBK6265020.1 hypothetical protein [Marivirga aurantiaca]
MIEHTYIELMGLTLADPLTFLTDLLMAGVCFFCGHRLFYDFGNKYSKLFGLFFLFLGFASFMGGTSHLLDEYLGKIPHLMAWLVQGVAILFVELACVRLIEKNRFRNLLRAITYGLFGIFISRLFNIQSFEVVKVNSTIGLMGFVFVIHLMKYYTTRVTAYLNVPLAIILFLIPAFIHGFGIFYNAWIDQNVISHLLLLPCYYLLYRSVGKVAVIPRMHTQPIPQSEQPQ